MKTEQYSDDRVKSRAEIETSTLSGMDMEHYSSSSGSHGSGRRLEKSLKVKQYADGRVQSVMQDFELEMKNFSDSLGSHLVGRKEQILYTDESITSENNESNSVN